MGDIIESAIDSSFDAKRSSVRVLNFKFTLISRSSAYRCGIVALCMALNTKNINCTIDELMKYAIDRKFTKNGEIFDGMRIWL